MTRKAEADLNLLLAVAGDMSCEGFNQLVGKLSRASFRGLEKHICDRQVRRRVAVISLLRVCLGVCSGTWLKGVR
jgi:hypothetical protein